MANGLCPSVLTHLRNIAGQNYNGDKVTQQGFLLSLLNTPNRPNVINDLGYANGHNRTVQVKYKPRAVESQASDSLSCDNNIINAYQETTVTLPYVAQVTTFFNDETIRTYCDDASQMTTLGTPPTRVMAEVLDGVLSSMNAIYAKMETDLTTSMSTQWGTYGSPPATVSTVNIPLTGTSNNLSEGIGVILANAEVDEFCGPVTIVGSGLFHRFARNQQAGAYSANQSGVNQGAMADALDYNFYLSQKTATTWGTNRIGVFAPGSVHLVQYNRNVGPAFTGDKGASTFARIIDPRVQCWAPGGYQNIEFDVQFKYLDCPQSVRNDYTGTTTTYDRGWLVMVSTSYGLFVNPRFSFDGADVASGSNGARQYLITNS